MTDEQVIEIVINQAKRNNDAMNENSAIVTDIRNIAKLALNTVKAQDYEKALRDIMEVDGFGCDGSPAGPCYEIAMRALREYEENKL